MRNKIKFLPLLILALAPFSGQSQMLTVSEVASMPEPVTNNAVVEGFINGVPYVYSFAGIDSTKGHAGIHLRSFRYNGQTDSWQTIAPLPDTLGKIAAGASRVGNTIYIIGGYHVFANGSELSSSKVHRYDINANTYLSDGVDIPIAIDDQVQAVWRDSLIFVVTGWSDVNNISAVQIYDPSQDSWQQGTPVPNNGVYKSFGASGVIIGDTIFYYGGARFGASFPIQNQLRKGVINPLDPTQITWTDTIPNTSFSGYRMAAATSNNYGFWIGGSQVTYNFDGIAYNGTGGVDPANRVLMFDATTASVIEDTSANIPMDLRGAAKLGPFTWHIAGGMLANQEVTNKSYRVSFDLVDNVLEPNAPLRNVQIYPNPASDEVNLRLPSGVNGAINISLIDALGRRLISRTMAAQPQLNLDIQNLIPGNYILELDRNGVAHRQLLIINR